MPDPTKDISNRDLAQLCRQAGSLIQAEVNILDVLDALKHQNEKPQLREVMDSVRHDIEMGRTIATAFSRYPAIFSPFFISMIRQGELEGELGQIFMNLAQHFESRMEDGVDRDRSKGAPAYDLEAVATAFKWIFVWLAVLGAAAFLCVGALWFAAGMGAFDPRWMGPAACLVVGVIMFLAVVLFSIRRR
jgi:MSHA biogenesis protein MshG